MTLFKEKYKISSNRLKNWDYSSEGMYFITLVTKDRSCIFGCIEDDKMILNENGNIIENELLKSIKIRKNWFFHNWVVMPNHIHLLIEIMERRFEHRDIGDTHIVDIQIPHTQIVETHSSASTSSISTNIEKHIVENIDETHCCAPLRDNRDQDRIVDIKIVENDNLNKIYNQNQLTATLSRKPNSISSFVAVFKSITTKQINEVGTIWQSNYHDRIVRNHKTFEIIYNYIKTNPRSWEMDSMKP